MTPTLDRYPEELRRRPHIRTERGQSGHGATECTGEVMYDFFCERLNNSATSFAALKRPGAFHFQRLIHSNQA